jgi:N6-adenosine-specific RNA methylase IME4
VETGVAAVVEEAVEGDIEGCYQTLIVDCPWKYDNFGAKKHGAARGHYKGMTEEQLAAIPVGRWAHKKSVLFHWATWPKLDIAMRLIPVWGFEYVTAIPWVKTMPTQEEIYNGIGFWTRSTSEVCLIARRGGAKAPKTTAKPGKKRGAGPMGLLVGEDRQFYTPRRRHHSTKPLSFMDWILESLPGPHLELFARTQVAGVVAWGFDTGYELGPFGVRYRTA